MHNIFVYHGIRNYSCHVKKGYIYSVTAAANWMDDMATAARDLNLRDAEYLLNVKKHYKYNVTKPAGPMGCASGHQMWDGRED